MSQTSPQICPQCQTPIYPGQRFCSNCGKTAPEPVAPTVASPPDAFGTPAPTVSATPYPNFPPNPNTSSPYGSGQQMPFPLPQSPYTQYSGNNSAPPPPPSYNTPVPPPPSNPYGASTSPNDPYGGTGVPNFAQAQSKKRSPLLYVIIGIVVVLLLACVGSALALRNAMTGVTGSNTASNSTGLLGGSNNSNSNTNTNSNFPSSQQLNNLAIVYSSDQMTFTSLQQADKFSDDSYTSFSSYNKSYYVRLNFKEQQQAKRSSYFSYTSAFHLILPDQSVVAGTKASTFSGPEQDVVRTNWVDFETKKPVDLSKLSIRLGADDEAQMQFPLQSGADVSKYQPKTVTLNKQFQYASMNWTLKDATQSLYADGQQAKNGKVYVTVDLVVDNPTQNSYYLYNFLRLKAGDTVSSTDYSSNLNDFDVIKSGTTNVQGSATFLTPSASTYTLDFLANTTSSYDNWPEKTVDFQTS